MIHDKILSKDDKSLAVEIMPVRIPNGVSDLVLDYLNADILPMQQSNNQTFKFFGRNIEKMMRDEAALVGNLILRGEEKDIEKALAIITSKPALLYWETVSTDPLGTPVKGKLLQIAAMAGDFDLRPGIVDEKNRGMVERLIMKGGLSKENVKEQLKVITSKEAQLENEERNHRYLNAIKKFGKSICTVESEGLTFMEFLEQCKNHINQLENDINTERSKPIRSGYIFDPIIIHEASKWFRAYDSVGWKAHIFWIYGIGKLQKKMSSRDAQVVMAGLEYLIDDNILPPRTLKNEEGRKYFGQQPFSSEIDYFVGYHGWYTTFQHASGIVILAVSTNGSYEKLNLTKNTSLLKITHQDKKAALNYCSLM